MASNRFKHFNNSSITTFCKVCLEVTSTRVTIKSIKTKFKMPSLAPTLSWSWTPTSTPETPQTTRITATRQPSNSLSFNNNKWSSSSSYHSLVWTTDNSTASMAFSRTTSKNSFNSSINQQIKILKIQSSQSTNKSILSKTQKYPPFYMACS